ncbi:MAG TPA: hypothetical protein VER96_21595 [Polyangiaceae bacterium]|nr:hypothetical protein [Polyangiaceae bacterium]
MKRLTPLQQSLRALLGLVVIVLQVLGALHFTLVQHGYSAALGGVVHVHAAARAEQKLPNRVAPRTATLVADLPACSAELCPEGNAPQSSAPQFELLATGFVAFGEARLLSERAASSGKSLRVFLSAPKTSPPV